MADSERLKEIIKSSKMSTKAFSESIGLKTPQILYDILKNRNGISKDVAEKIHAKCVNYNLAWIRTGDGVKFKDENKNDNLINDKFEPYGLTEVTILQRDFSSLVETLNRQQKTIESQAKTIENLTEKKNGDNGDIAGSA